MIKTITGDILNVKNGIICHQVNYYGSMGGGVAASIAERILPDDRYKEYVDYCKKYGRTALGHVQFLNCGDIIVANLFCQDDALLSDKRRPFVDTITNYDLMSVCFASVRSAAQISGKRIYIPRKIGCGIAGGDWRIVKGLIEEAFEFWPVEAFIVERGKN